MTLKFKAEDFNFMTSPQAAQYAQQLFDKFVLECPIVYISKNTDSYWVGNSQPFLEDTHQARLICIEPIQKCPHESEKVKWIRTTDMYLNTPHWEYQCECGTKVEPSEFREVK